MFWLQRKNVTIGKKKNNKKKQQLWAWRNDVCGLLNLEAGMFSCVSFIKNVDWEDGPGSECVGWFYRPSDGATFLLRSVALLADLQVSHLPLEKVDVSFLIFYVSHLWKGDTSKSCIVALKPASQEKKSLLIALPADLHICWLMNPFSGSLYYAFIPKVTSHHSVRSVLTGADLGCFQPDWAPLSWQ